MSSVLDMAQQDMQDTQKAMEPVSDRKIAHVSHLANRQIQLEREVSHLEQALKDKKSELRKVQEDELPEAMDAVGQASFKLIDGTKVSVEPYYGASIPEDCRERAMTWLEDNGHSGIIRVEVIVAFKKGEREKAESFANFARGFNEAKVEPKLKQGVHAGTLKVFTREMTEQGETLPADLFTVYIGRKAKIVK